MLALSTYLSMVEKILLTKLSVASSGGLYYLKSGGASVGSIYLSLYD
jgi:hypothetical protein